MRPTSLRRSSASLGLVLVFVLSAAGPAHAQTATIKYEVSRAGTTKADFHRFGYTVDAVLNDPRGWSLSGAVRFRRVSSGGRFTVRLTDPRVVGSYGGCSSYYSCRVGRYVMINDNRWRFATPSFRNQPLHLYRQMVVNHEVGHALGFGHATCRGAGLRAWVMQQQSKGLDGCVQNPWPLWGERRTLARRLGVRVGRTPPGIEPGERIGVVELGASREQLLGRLGDPARTRRSGGSFLLEYPGEGLRVRMMNGRVAGVSTGSEAYSTRGGVRVGSTSRDVRSRWSHATCDATSCVIEGSRAVTISHFKEGRVTKIRLERRDGSAAPSATTLRESDE